MTTKTNTYPSQIYPIRVDNAIWTGESKTLGVWIQAVRTRGTWNDPSTGRFIAHDILVEDVLFRCMCENPECINSNSVYWFEQSLNISRFVCSACRQKMKVIDFNENPD